MDGGASRSQLCRQLGIPDTFQWFIYWELATCVRSLSRVHKCVCTCEWVGECFECVRCMSVSVCMCVWEWMCVWVSVCVCVCVCVNVMCVCVHVCVCGCECECIHVCKCLCWMCVWYKVQCNSHNPSFRVVFQACRFIFLTQRMRLI